MALCHSCIDVLRDNKTQKIHSTCRSFLAAANEGCYVCQGLFSEVPEEWKQEIRRHAEISEPSVKKRRKLPDSETWLTQFEAPRRRAYIWLNLRGLNAEASLHRVDIPAGLRLTVSAIPAELFSSTLTSSSTSSEETFTKLKAWLSRCGRTHNKCRFRRNGADMGWYPTRLVEVTLAPGIGQNANDLKCRVVETHTGDMTQNLRYITLSHRWPKDQHGFHKLTEDNMPLWKASLPIKMLRQTFRDAFFVAYKFGISYVWIDSICIIQDGDNHADWRKEAPMVQKVYSNAEFNICASKKDQNGGLFSLRKPPFPQPLQVELQHLDEFEYHKLTDNGHHSILNKSTNVIWDARMNDSPLASRGWVFQEQLLSRANLHFCDDEVLFECLEMRASESLGSDEDYKAPWRKPLPFFKEYLPIPAVAERGLVSSAETSGSGGNCSDLPQETFDKYYLWYGLLGQYTPRQLTKSEDRLVALSGVARYFKGIFWNDDYYIAGLWRSRLTTEMLWQMTKWKPREDWEKQKKARHHLTFSWASVGVEVTNKVYARRNLNYVKHLAKLDVIKYRISLKALDATGCEEHSFTEDVFSLPTTPTIEIKVTGLLRQMSLKRVDGVTLEGKWPVTSESTWADSDLFIYSMRRDGPLKGYASLDFEIGSSDLTALNNSGRLFLMPLVAIGSISVWLLLLEHIDTDDEKDMRRFRRIGVQEVKDDSTMRSLRNWNAERSSLVNSGNRSKQETIFII